jgi:hypothetical protein
MEQDRSLRQNADAIDKINDIRLSLNSIMGCSIVWILVEGEDDCKIYPKFFVERSARVEFVNGGKAQLSIALDTLTKESKQVIGIQDADFVHLEKIYDEAKNLFYTDYHDIEMTMLSFDAVRDNMFTEYGLKNRLNVWNNVLTQAAFVGFIRWYNNKNDCRILFSGLGYGHLIDLRDGTISLNKHDLLNELNTRSRNKVRELTLADLNAFIDENRTSDLLNVCNGHDVTALLSLFVGGAVSHKELCRHLRLSFTLRDFLCTKLYCTLFDWQTTNGFFILKTIENT